MPCKVLFPFEDWDKQRVEAGEHGTLVERGTGNDGISFWNLIAADGRVIAVMFGKPPMWQVLCDKHGK